MKINKICLAGGCGLVIFVTFVRSWPPRSTTTASPGPKTLSSVQNLNLEEPTPTPSGERWIKVVSRRLHGTAGVFDLDLSTGPRGYGVEPRAGPYQQVVVMFSQPVTLNSIDLIEGVGTVVDVAGSDTDQIVITLADVADAQLLGFYLTYSWISDPSEPSDPANPQILNFYFGVLLGDLNESGTVTSGDAGLCGAQALQPLTNDNFLCDVNASGAITSGDANIIRQNALHAIQEAAP